MKKLNPEQMIKLEKLNQKVRGISFREKEAFLKETGISTKTLYLLLEELNSKPSVDERGSD